MLIYRVIDYRVIPFAGLWAVVEQRATKWARKVMALCPNQETADIVRWALLDRLERSGGTVYLERRGGRT